MREGPAIPVARRLWASLSEGRPPHDNEVERFAAKIWHDAYRSGAEAGAEWRQVEVGSPPHRRSMAAALAALAPGAALLAD